MNKYIIPLFFIVLLSCSEDKEMLENNNDIKDYSTVFFDAFKSNDVSVITNGIDYIQDLIDKGYGKKNSSLYYNKAQLYLKLGEYEEAFICIDSIKEDTYRELLKGTLLLRLNDKAKAYETLNTLLISLDKILVDHKLNNKDMLQLLQNKLQVLKLLDEDYHSFYNELITNKKFENYDLYYIEKTYELDNSYILDGLWPK